MAKKTVTADTLAVGKNATKGKVALNDAPLVVTGKKKAAAAAPEPEPEEEEEEEEEESMLPTELLSLDQLIENPNNPRELFANIDELAASIEQNGLKTALVVRETGKTKNGKPVYMIISGHRRTRAMKMLGKAYADMPIKAEIQPVDYDPKQAVYDDLAFNDGKELTLLEQGTVFDRARELGDKNADIARKAGKSQTHVQDCLLLHDKASAKLKKDISSGKVSATMVLDMLKEEGEEKTEKVIEAAKAANPGKKITQKHADKAAGEAVGKSKSKAKTAAKTSKVVDKAAPKPEAKAESSETASVRMSNLIDTLESQSGVERKEEAFEFIKDVKKWLDGKIEAQDLAHYFFELEEEEEEEEGGE